MKTSDRKGHRNTRKAAQQPRVVAASGMLDRKLTVVRQEGESDARYQSRQELFELLLDKAKRG